MTTPTDAIAGLSERLNKLGPEGSLFREIGVAAATAIDALQARVKELEAEFESASAAASEYSEFWELHSGDFDAAGNYIPHSQIDGDLRAAESRALRAEQERDEAIRQLIRSEDRAILLQQERDEAYERLKPFATAADSLDDKHSDRSDIWESPSAMEITAKHLRAARDLVRRLAGPEKEGK